MWGMSNKVKLHRNHGKIISQCSSGKREKPYNHWEPIYIGTNEVYTPKNISYIHITLDCFTHFKTSPSGTNLRWEVDMGRKIRQDGPGSCKNKLASSKMRKLKSWKDGPGSCEKKGIQGKRVCSDVGGARKWIFGPKKLVLCKLLFFGPVRNCKSSQLC